MTPSVSFLPLVPILVPLIGACVIGLVSAESVIRARRGIYLAALVITCFALVALGLRGTEAPRLPFGRLYSVYGQVLEFTSGALAIQVSLMFTGVLTLVGLAFWSQPLRQGQAVLMLLLTALVVASCSAANLLTMCVAWGAMDLLLLARHLLSTPEKEMPQVIRRLWLNLGSTVLLIMATVWVAADYNQTHFAYSLLDAGPTRLLLLAAILRLGAFPLPGRPRSHWEGTLVALCTGGYLWLHVTGLSSHVTGIGWLTALGAGSLLATAILAFAAIDFASALPYLTLHGITLLMIGPLLDPGLGFAAGLMMLLTLGICLGMLAMNETVWPIPPVGRRARWPLLVALAALAGWPLTMGLVARWALLYAAWETGARSIFLWLLTAYILAGVPVWRQFHLIRRGIGLEEQVQARPTLWIALACAVVLALSLVLPALYPPLLAQLWPAATMRFDLPGWPALLGGNGTPATLGLVLAAMVGGLVGSHSLERATAGVSSHSDAGQALASVASTLQLTWLYVGIETALSAARRTAENVLSAIEEPLFLGWTLAWALVIVMYFLER